VADRDDAIHWIKTHPHSIFVRNAIENHQPLSIMGMKFEWKEVQGILNHEVIMTLEEAKLLKERKTEPVPPPRRRGLRIK
jgi:hypothetical protein